MDYNIRSIIVTFHMQTLDQDHACVFLAVHAVK